MKLQRAPFGLRMPEEVQNWVKGVAVREDRSQNYVINQILLNEMKRAAGDQFGDQAPAAGSEAAAR